MEPLTWEIHIMAFTFMQAHNPTPSVALEIRLPSITGMALKCIIPIQISIKFLATQFTTTQVWELTFEMTGMMVYLHPPSHQIIWLAIS
jgi:hypothetical protein